jgi:hypothetical protein
MTKKARYIKTLESFSGEARLYAVDPPVSFPRFCDEGEQQKTNFIIVSAINNYHGRETYIFAANALGEVIDWAELEGSQRNIVNHSKVLKDAGYELISA